MKQLTILFTTLILFVTFGCTKEADPEIISSTNDTSYVPSVHISDTPSISFQSILPTNPVQYQDSVVITFSYLDGNGDLGENLTEEQNLFVTDNRNSIVYEYRIPQLSPTLDTEVAIQGSFQVVINTVTVIDPNNVAETFNYSLYVVDRAGNISNTISTDDVTVNLP